MSGVKDFSEDFMVEDAPPAGRQRPGSAGGGAQSETDPHRLAQRQKQVDIGKNTVGYQRYKAEVPRDKRDRKAHPFTPDVYQVCSKRAFDGQVKKWRRMLHAWDLPEGEGEPALLSVQEDVGRPAANPPPPAGGEPSGDFVLVSHADAAPGASKNGAGLRQGGGNLPLKIPSAMRKRAYDETTASSENQRPQPTGQQRSLRAGSAQPARGGAPPDAKQARHSHRRAPTSNGAAAARTPAAAPASEPSWAEQRYTDPQLDYGDQSEDEDGWQHVQPQQLPGEYKMVFNNEVAWEDDIQI